MYALIDHLSQQYNGYCTWDLSQSLPPVDRMARMGGVDMGRGICLGLASHWIRYHAWDDSLVNHLGGIAINNGHSFIPLNIRLLARIKQCQQQWRGRLDDALIWLGNPVNDIIKVRTSLNTPVHLNIGRGGNAVRLTNLPGSRDAVRLTNLPGSRNANTRGHVVNWAGMSDDLDKVSGAYAMIVLHGPRGGHACTAWIGGRGEDACFFDPNFGEYWFEDKRNFFRFLRLFAQNFYNARMGMDRYEIQPLARRVRLN